MVADADGRLLGTITDGDIRRALLRTNGLETTLSEVMNREPTVAYIDSGKDEILALMKSRDILQVPVVDRDGRIIDLETIQQIIQKNSLDNHVFLMAGGFGKRLRPLTEETPKPLLRVGEKPILQTIIEQFIGSGFQNFIISVHYKAEMVKEYFGNGERWGVDITYTDEKMPLGTAGALGLLPKGLITHPLIVMNGDLLTKINFEYLLKFHCEQGGIATMCAREYDLQVPYGVVEAEGQRVTRIVEKPVHKFFVNAGVYVLEPRLIGRLSGRGYVDMPNLLEEQIERGEQVSIYPVHEYWIDIGHRKEYEQAKRDMISRAS